MGPAEFQSAAPGLGRRARWGPSLRASGPLCDSVCAQKPGRAGLHEGASLKSPSIKHLINYMFLQIVHLPNFDINCAQVPFRPRGNYIYLEFITIVPTRAIIISC